MKYIKGLVFVLCATGVLGGTAILPVACAGFRAENRIERKPPSGYYEGAAQGYRGTIRVHVRYAAETITEIIIVDSREDRSVGGAAMEELLELVLQYNTTDLDAVSGATESSEAFLAAVENAILSQ